MIWKDKKVFITGHTGFKGGWLSLWLTHLGAKVCGFSLENIEKLAFYNKTDLSNKLEKSLIGDIRNLSEIKKAVKEYKPEIIFHMAAQPLVRESYINPIGTYETNVMGTLNVFEAARESNSVKKIINITTDKCYENKEWNWPYREIDSLGGYDPYSSSKACSEILSSSYRNSFFSKGDIQLATARAGNVIGGGDWSSDRLIPDFFRSLISENKVISIRYPNSTRPWQHVLESLNGYISLAESLYINESNTEGAWNFGPFNDDPKNVLWIMQFMQRKFPEIKIIFNKDNQPHESSNLKLDISKSLSRLNWKPMLTISEALELTIDWYRSALNNEDMLTISLEQIKDFEKKIANNV